MHLTHSNPPCLATFGIDGSNLTQSNYNKWIQTNRAKDYYYFFLLSDVSHTDAGIEDYEYTEHIPSGFTLPTVKRFPPTSGIGKPAVNRRKPLETARNDNSNSKNR